MALVITPTEIGAAGSVFWFRLGSLGRLHRSLSPRHTLFVPPERPAPADEAFAARTASLEECLSRVEIDGRGAVLQQPRREVLGELTDLPPDLQAESVVLAERWRSRRRVGDQPRTPSG